MRAVVDNTPIMLRFELASLLAVGLLCACSSGPPPVAAPAASRDNLSQDAYAKAHHLELTKFDLNRDGKPDIFKFYKVIPDPKDKGNTIKVLVRKELDINNDGKIDVVRIYNDDGQLTKESTDLDFDGRMDETSYYNKGKLVRKEIDLNYDGKPDVIKYYVDGKLDHIESDRTGDGRIDTWEYYENGKLDRIGVDTDGDGQADSWQHKHPDLAQAKTPAGGNKGAAKNSAAGAGGKAGASSASPSQKPAAESPAGKTPAVSPKSPAAAKGNKPAGKKSHSK